MDKDERRENAEDAHERAVLSGALDDGTLGCTSIAARGGMTLVRDPADATCDSMPLSAIAFDSPSHVATAPELGRIVVELARGVPIQTQVRIAPMDSAGIGSGLIVLMEARDGVA